MNRGGLHTYKAHYLLVNTIRALNSETRPDWVITWLPPSKPFLEIQELEGKDFELKFSLSNDSIDFFILIHCSKFKSASLHFWRTRNDPIEDWSSRSDPKEKVLLRNKFYCISHCLYVFIIIYRCPINRASHKYCKHIEKILIKM